MRRRILHFEVRRGRFAVNFARPTESREFPLVNGRYFLPFQPRFSFISDLPISSAVIDITRRRSHDVSIIRAEANSATHFVFFLLHSLSSTSRNTLRIRISQSIPRVRPAKRSIHDLSIWPDAKFAINIRARAVDF